MCARQWLWQKNSGLFQIADLPVAIEFVALTNRQTSASYDHRSHSTHPASDTGAATHAAGGGDGMGARRFRRHALLAGVGLAHARSGYDQDSRRNSRDTDAAGVGDRRRGVWVSGG